MSRNYAKEYENYHSSPKQKKRRGVTTPLADRWKGLEKYKKATATTFITPQVTRVTTAGYL